MDKTASIVSAKKAPRRGWSFWRLLKQGAKNTLFPLPGARKTMIILRQRLDRFLYALKKPAPQALFRPNTQPGKPRAMVVSIPKSGTHLVQGLLAEMGMIDTDTHLSETGYYDFRDVKGSMKRDSSLKISSPLAVSASRVGAGQFAAGHVMALTYNQNVFKDFRLFFVYRESRAVFISFMRWLSGPGHGDEYGTAWKEETDDKKRMERFMRLYAPSFTVIHRDIAGWIHCPRALPVKFEILCGDEGGEAQLTLVKKIAAHIDLTLSDARAGEIIEKTIGASSRTWSGKRSSLESYWSNDSETLFLKAGGARLNRLLGYT